MPELPRTPAPIEPTADQRMMALQVAQFHAAMTGAGLTDALAVQYVTSILGPAVQAATDNAVEERRRGQGR